MNDTTSRIASGQNLYTAGREKTRRNLTIAVVGISAVASVAIAATTGAWLVALGLFVLTSCAAGFTGSLAFDDPADTNGKVVGFFVGAAILVGMLILIANGADTWLTDFIIGI